MLAAVGPEGLNVFPVGFPEDRCLRKHCFVTLDAESVSASGGAFSMVLLPVRLAAVSRHWSGSHLNL